MTRALRTRWLLLAAAPAVASGCVLALASVGRSTWVVQLTAIVLSGGVALGVRALGTRVLGTPALRTATRGRGLAGGFAVATAVALALPLLRAGDGPARWISLGGVLLYVAPVVLPAAIASLAVLLTDERGDDRLALVSIALSAVALVVQPDASQLLALLAAWSVIAVRSPRLPPRRLLTLGATALMAAWSFMRPDPLLPVPHVEQVFALALAHSLPAGLAVIAAAVVVVTGVALPVSSNASWQPPVATYYATLFACSVFGLTPAPLIGYGAGPWLGFGLLAGITRALEEASDAPA